MEHLKKWGLLYGALAVLLFLVLYPFYTQTVTDKDGKVISTSKTSIIGTIFTIIKNGGKFSIS